MFGEQRSAGHDKANHRSGILKKLTDSLEMPGTRIPETPSLNAADCPNCDVDL